MWEVVLHENFTVEVRLNARATNPFQASQLRPVYKVPMP